MSPECTYIFFVSHPRKTSKLSVFDATYFSMEDHEALDNHIIVEPADVDIQPNDRAKNESIQADSTQQQVTFVILIPNGEKESKSSFTQVNDVISDIHHIKTTI